MKPLTHHQRLIELLRTLDDARTAWHPNTTGDGPILMPSMWNEGSYPELEHQLAQLRDNPNTRNSWWHLSHRYRWGITHKETVPCRRTRLGPIPRLRPNTELVSAGTIHGNHQAIIVYEWRTDVNQAAVDAGLDNLLERMHGGQPHQIKLPLEVYCRATGIPIPERRLTPTGRHATLVA